MSQIIFRFVKILQDVFSTLTNQMICPVLETELIFTFAHNSIMHMQKYN